MYRVNGWYLAKYLLNLHPVNRVQMFTCVGLLLLSGSLHALEIPLIGGPVYLQQAIGEEQKIQQLIRYVEQTDAQFIRNGTTYTGTEAAKHLRMKREKAGSRIRLARDFIDLVASKSSMSGEPYQMKFKNGITLNVRDVLYNELRKIESRPVGAKRSFKVTRCPVC